MGFSRKEAVKRLGKTISSLRTAADPHTHHRLLTDLPPQPKQLVIDTADIVRMGEGWADWVVETEQD